MRLSTLLPAFYFTAVASAASIDMDDPRRALGREENVRIDAQLVRDTVSPGAPVAITYRIQNLSASSVAIADRVSDASYDAETRTITLAVGSEVPPEHMPHMVVVAPGETKVLSTSATPSLTASAHRIPSAPRYVQVKVAIMRDLRPFLPLIQKQNGQARQPISDELFDQWFECNDTIFLNSVPVYFEKQKSVADAEERHARGGW
jgi:hypothetical protein